MKLIEFEKSIKKIEGLKLDAVRYACEMLMFSFGQYALHVQCLARIIKNNDILVTTSDYQSWDGEQSDNNDEYYNLAKYLTEIEGGRVISVKVSPLFYITINIDNGVIIEIIIQNSYAHYDVEQEQYRFFKDSEYNEENQKDLHSHYVIYSKHIDIK